MAKQPAIGYLIRELRQQLQLSQQKFASQLGVAILTVKRWENNHTKPSQLALKQISEMLRLLGEPGFELLTKYFPAETTAFLPVSTSSTTAISPREPNTKIELFTQHIKDLRQRLTTLSASVSCSAPAELLGAALEELSTTLEELEVAQDELYQQNSELESTRLAVEAERQRYQDLFEFAPDGYLVTDEVGTIREANRAAATLLNISQDFLVGKPLANFIAAQERRGFRDALNQLHQVHQIQEWELRLCPRKREPIDAALTVLVIRNQESTPIGLRLCIRDITLRKQAEEKLREHAFYDPLTHLPNRALFMDRLERAIRQTKRHQDYLFAVLFLDLDRFKVINDSLGHTFGDQLLSAVASRLLACLRPTDTVARLGGDEFTILIEGIQNISDAIRVAERVQAELRLPFVLGKQEVFTTASIGIALSATGYDKTSDMLRDADIAMYRAKRRGLARYEIFNTAMHLGAVTRLQVENDLRQAIERQEFQIYYQPIVSLKIGRIIGFEALARWQHPDRGLLLPKEFLTVVEETELSLPFDQWVLRTACRQTREWQLAFPTNPPLTISVNFCSKQFAQPNLIEQINQVIQETGLDAKSLKLEITESVIMENAQSARDMLLQLKALGIQLAIDDFGTGYSSLGRLHNFPISVLKIDRSFISPTETDFGNLEIVGTIVTLAHNLGMEVTAEGVETAEQLARLTQLNCEYGQGYFLSPPLNSEKTEALIRSSPRWGTSKSQKAYSTITSTV